MAKGVKTGGGSRKGKPNKVAADVRAAIAEFAQGRADRFGAWIDRVALSDPARAADLYLKAIEWTRAR